MNTLRNCTEAPRCQSRYFPFAFDIGAFLNLQILDDHPAVDVGGDAVAFHAHYRAIPVIFLVDALKGAASNFGARRVVERSLHIEIMGTRRQKW